MFSKYLGGLRMEGKYFVQLPRKERPEGPAGEVFRVWRYSAASTGKYCVTAKVLGPLSLHADDPIQGKAMGRT